MAGGGAELSISAEGVELREGEPLAAVSSLPEQRPTKNSTNTIIPNRAARLIECNSHAHLVSKASSVISSKSPSRVGMGIVKVLTVLLLLPIPLIDPVL